MELSQSNVSKIFKNCLCKDDVNENLNNHVFVDYEDTKYHFDKDAISNNKDFINSMILGVQTYERTNKQSRVKQFCLIIDMSKNDKDQRWTKSDVAVRQLKILGLATEILIPCEDLKCEHFYVKI